MYDVKSFFFCVRLFFSLQKFEHRSWEGNLKDYTGENGQGTQTDADQVFMHIEGNGFEGLSAKLYAQELDS